MSWLTMFLRSTVGSKAAMAVSGVILYGFTLVHMAGNLNVFLGQKAMAEYVQVLHLVPEVVWAVRAVLLACLVVHIGAYSRLLAQTRAARPVAYKSWKARASTFASRSMLVTGPLLLIYIVVHLLHLTVGALQPLKYQSGEHAHLMDAYANLVNGLGGSWWWMGGFYLIVSVTLGVHLWHGGFAFTKTLGLSAGRQLQLARLIATALAVTVAGGNVLIVTALLTGLVK